MLKIAGLILAVSGSCILSSACVSNTNFVGIVLNNGEKTNFKKIESMGNVDVNYFKTPGYYVLDSSNVFPEQDTIPIVSLQLISESFQYDPFAIANPDLKPLYSFAYDTLIITDYWALTDQPAFQCSTSFVNDTLHIKYVPSPGAVNDWNPEVKTTMKFVIKNNSPVEHSDISVYFHKNAYARKSTIPRCRDASIDYITTIPLISYTYKYRAVSDSTLLVNLDYQMMNGVFKGAPQISLNYDNARQYSLKLLISNFKKELTWLKTDGIIDISETIISKFDTTDTLMGGTYYWTKQDSVLQSNAYFYTNTDVMQSNQKSRCGGIEFNLPRSALTTVPLSIKRTSFKTPGTRHNVIVSHKQIAIESNTSFDNFRIFNAQGKQVFYGQINNASDKMNINLPTALKPGLYLFESRLGNRSISRTSLMLQ